MSNTERNISAGPLVEPLTRSERDILALLAQGYTAPEIAERLTLAVSSVKWYVHQLYGKLGVNGKRQALNRARELGLLKADSNGPQSTSPLLTTSPATVLQGPAHNLPVQ